MTSPRPNEIAGTRRAGWSARALPAPEAVDAKARCLDRLPAIVASDAALARCETEAAEVRQAKIDQGVVLGQGELSQVGRDAHAAQRADPEHSPHFGG